MLELLKLLSDFQPLSIDFDHIEVVLNAHHVSSELAHSFLLVVAYIVLLQQFVLEMLEVEIDIKVLKEAAISDFLDIGVVNIQVVQSSLGLHHGHVGHHLDMPQHRSVETLGLLLLLTDEDVLT